MERMTLSDKQSCKALELATHSINWHQSRGTIGIHTPDYICG